jgi:hypothetical protein
MLKAPSLSHVTTHVVPLELPCHSRLLSSPPSMPLRALKGPPSVTGPTVVLQRDRWSTRFGLLARPGRYRPAESALFWCQHSDCSGTSIPLESALFWSQHCSGVSIVLESALFWSQHCSGVSIVLESALFWSLEVQTWAKREPVHQNPDTRKVLVPEKLWC